MALEELWKSRKHNQTPDEKSEERVYLCDGLVDAPTIGSQVVIQGILMSVSNVSVERYTDSKWICTVRYSDSVVFASGDAEQYEYDFDMSTASRQITRAYGQVPAVKLPKPINRFEPNLVYRISRNEVAPSLATLMGTVGRLNKQAWHTGAAKTWLCLGAIIRQTSATGTYKWRVSYTITYSPSANGAWQAIFESDEDVTTNDLAYDIYKTVNFATLGLTSPF